ncbi:MAG: hypothetical protein ACTS8R_02825 [Arsenophonus sp. NC-QC1-MAG3]
MINSKSSFMRTLVFYDDEAMMEDDACPGFNEGMENPTQMKTGII